MSEEVMSWGR